MRRPRILLIFFLFGIIFLWFQVYILKQILTPHMNQNSAAIHKEDHDQHAYDNIKSFVEICEDNYVRVILIDPPILKKILNIKNSSVGISSKHCKFLCDPATSTAFGVKAAEWYSKDIDIVDEMKMQGFQVADSYVPVPSLADREEAEKTQLLTHVILQRENHMIHVVVLYERANNTYWWHGPFNFFPRQKQEMNLDADDFHFGAHAGAYDRMDVANVQLDNVYIYAPRYPARFLIQIPHSKFLECNHSQAKTFYSLYPKDRSKKAVAFQKSAVKTLKKGNDILNKLGVRFWMSSGTCLGWFRQCDIIPYSDDVDFGIWIKDYNRKLIPTFKVHGFELEHQFGRLDDSFQLSFKDGPIKLDMFFFYEEPAYMWNGGTQLKTGKKFKYRFETFTLCWTEFFDTKIRVPCDTKTYIEANYGKHWFTPVKSWDWKKSPPNVQENGQWSDEEWDDVIHLGHN